MVSGGLGQNGANARSLVKEESRNEGAAATTLYHSTVAKIVLAYQW